MAWRSRRADRSTWRRRAAGRPLPSPPRSTKLKPPWGHPIGVIFFFWAPAGGGPATPIAPEFYQTQAPVWSPDGRYLLFWGQRDRDAPPENNVDWYLAPVTGGAPIRTDARRV